MKNPPKAARQKAKRGKSPYKKYGKRPHKYSPAYNAWKARALRKGVSDNG